MSLLTAVKKRFSNPADWKVATVTIKNTRPDGSCQEHFRVRMVQKHLCFSGAKRPGETSVFRGGPLNSSPWPAGGEAPKRGRREVESPHPKSTKVSCWTGKCHPLWSPCRPTFGPLKLVKNNSSLVPLFYLKKSN